MNTGDEPHRRLHPVILPIVDARFINPDLLRDLSLEESEVKPPGPEVVAQGYKGGGIRLRLRFFGR